ncbi:MAG: hypothetical protein M3294_03070, partial [Pseudomonadota bacterium]|nr:hypothetical protein [Pseudomonadota bacterium]
MPVYRIGSTNIDGLCRIEDVDVAVFPGGSRSLLDLSALWKTAPFSFSMKPPDPAEEQSRGFESSTERSQAEHSTKPVAPTPTNVVRADDKPH